MVQIFPQTSIDEMRRINAQNLSSTAQLLLEQTISDGSGGEESLGWGAYDTQCCRLSPVDVSERLVADQMASKIQWWIIFNWDVQIPAKNRIQIGERVFEIVGDLGIRTNQVMAKFLCIEDKDIAPV